MKKDIVDEFLEETHDFPTIFVAGFEQCFVCGMRPDKMKALAKAIKKLKEKAWKYDDLSK